MSGWQEPMASRRQLRSPGCVSADAEHQGALSARARKGGRPAAAGGGRGTRVHARLPVPTPPTVQPAPLSVSARLRGRHSWGSDSTHMDLAGTIRDSGGHGPEQVGSVLINMGPAATLAERLELSSFTGPFVWTASSFRSDLF